MTLVNQLSSELLLGRDPMQLQPLVRRIGPHLSGCPFTLAAVDIALWDIAGKVLDVPVSVLLGGRFRNRIALCRSVGWGSGDHMAAAALAQIEDHAYEYLKLYVGRDPLECDLGRAETVRSQVGHRVKFLLDVNGGWSVQDIVAALPRLRELGVDLIEQPIAAWDHAGQQELFRDTDIDVVADEAAFDYADTTCIARLCTAHVVNLGLSKLGGLLRARECEIVARSNGVRVMIGSVLEMGIATAAGLHLAAAVPHLAYPSYLVGPMQYTQDISWPTLSVKEGFADVPAGPGLGIEIDTDAVTALDLRH